MTHTDYEIMISMALDGELDEEEHEALQGHLDTCNACMLTYESMLEVDALFGASVVIAPPSPDFTALVMAKIEAYDRRQQIRPYVLAAMGFSAVTAALSVMLPAAYFFFGWRPNLPDWHVFDLIGFYVAQAYTDVAASVIGILDGVIEWAAYTANDPASLAILLAGLVLASTWVGYRESMRFSSTGTSRQTA